MWNSSFKSLNKLLQVLVRYRTRYPIVSKNSGSTLVQSARIEPFKSAPSLACTSVRLENNKGINIDWGEEKNAQEDHFHGVWLRHNCHCSLCLRKETNQKVVDLVQLDEPSITDVDINGKK